MKGGTLPKEAMPEVIQNYNHNFSSPCAGFASHLQSCSKSFFVLYVGYSTEWHPQEMKNAIISVIFLQEDKETRTLRICKACSEKFNSALPLCTRKRKKPNTVPKLLQISIYRVIRERPTIS